MSILDRDNRHLFLEEQNNEGNSFVANVNIIAANIPAIISIGQNIDDIVTVADNVNDVITVATNIDDVGLVARHLDNIDKVADDLVNIDINAAHIGNIDIAAAHAGTIDTVAGKIEYVERVGQYVSYVQAVANNIDHVKNVNMHMNDILTVEQDMPVISEVASQNIPALATQIQNNANDVRQKQADVTYKYTEIQSKYNTIVTKVDEASNLVDRSIILLNSSEAKLEELSDLGEQFQALSISTEYGFANLTNAVQLNILDAAKLRIDEKQFEEDITARVSAFETDIRNNVNNDLRDRYNEIEKLVEDAWEQPNNKIGDVEAKIDEEIISSALQDARLSEAIIIGSQGIAKNKLEIDELTERFDAKQEKDIKRFTDLSLANVGNSKLIVEISEQETHSLIYNVLSTARLVYIELMRALKETKDYLLSLATSVEIARLKIPDGTEIDSANIIFVSADGTEIPLTDVTVNRRYGV